MDFEEAKQRVAVLRNKSIITVAGIMTWTIRKSRTANSTL